MTFESRSHGSRKSRDGAYYATFSQRQSPGMVGRLPVARRDLGSIMTMMTRCQAPLSELKGAPPTA